MKSGNRRVRVVLALVVSILVGLVELPENVAMKAQTKIGVAVMSEETALPASMSPIPAETPLVMPTETPGESELPATESPVPLKLTLFNEEAKPGANGQAGIKYGRVKRGKFYHITTYVTDAIKLRVNHEAFFQVVGAKNKKEFKRKVVRVSGQGVVKCTPQKKGIHEYAVIKITSQKSGEIIYVHFHFLPKLYTKSAKKQTVFIGKKSVLKFNYAKNKIQFGSSSEKVATVTKKGVLHAWKKGIATITAKVKGSLSNRVRFKIIVKEEPWLVNAKDTCYTYSDMTTDLHQISAKYGSKASVFSIGKSYDNRELWCLRLGNPGASKKIVMDAGIHAREWLNCQMLTHKAEEILRRYSEFKESLQKECVYILPMLNPDGVSISQMGFSAIRSPKLRKICKKTKCSAKTWKANARGVNLNNNFPAGWKVVKKKAKHKKPHGCAFYGKKAASELETREIIRFIKNISGLQGVLNFHSTGQVLYWNYDVEAYPELWSRQKQLAYKIHDFNHYTLMPKGRDTAARGGMGDWLAYSRKVPTVTVETGSSAAPLPHGELKKIDHQNTKMIDWFIRTYV